LGFKLLGFTWWNVLLAEFVLIHLSWFLWLQVWKTKANQQPRRLVHPPQW
jgi:hypothetical protein